MKFLVVAGAFAASQVAASHPIAKVIQSLVDLRVKSKEEGEAEELAFTKFSHWCGNEKEAYSNKIAKNKQSILELTDQIEGLEASNASLAEQIANLGAEIDARTADQQRADGLRSEGVSLFTQNEQDLKDTIQAIGDAVEGLKSSKKSLAEVKSGVKTAAIAAASIMSHAEHKKLHAFLQADEASFLQEEPVGKGSTGRVREYDFKSGGVIGLLEKLHRDFEVQLLDTQKAETNATNSHVLVTKAQDAAVDAAEKSKSTKEGVLASQQQDLAGAKADKNDEEGSLSENERTLKDTTAECSTKANEYDERQKTRGGEQTAITTAIEILAKVGGVRNPDAQKIHAKAMMFVQLSKDDPRAEAVKLIMQSAKVNHNARMERLAQQIKMQKGPFTQIKNQIQKMIFHLNKEQQDEDNHKHWCDTELETTEQSLDDTNEKLESLQAKIDKLVSNIADLTKKISLDTTEVSDTNAYIKDETEMRNENQKQNDITIVDSKKGQVAVTAAIGVLTQFYKESGGVTKEAWEFIQKPAYAGQADGEFGATDGHQVVLDLLETVLQNFSTMEAEATAANEGDQAAYDQDMSDKKVLLAELRNNIKMKTSRKNTAEQNLENTEKTHKKTSNQKEALEIYQKDLDQPCVAGDSSYDDRKASRASEIVSLKDALKVLKEAFDAPKSFLARNY